jgi:NAD+ kinase
VSINDTFFTSYAADGLIVATPTGSTAYAFSVRGPIVSPRQRALIVTPVSAHMLFDRSLVLDESETVRIELIDDRPAMLTVDGRELGTMTRGDAIALSVGAHSARFVTFGRRDFYSIVKTKFGLSDR